MIAAPPEAVLARCRSVGALHLADPLVKRHATEDEVAEVLERFSTTRESLAALRFDDDDASEMAARLALVMTDDQPRAHVAAIAVRLGVTSVEETFPKPESPDPYKRPSGRDNGGSHAHE